MELLLILIYVSICYVTFKVFRIPVNQWSLATAAPGGIIGIALLLLIMNYNHPFTKNARIYFAVTPVLPTVRGRVIEVPVKENASLKEGDVLFRIDPRPYEYVVEQKKALLAEAEQNVRQAQGLARPGGSSYRKAQCAIRTGAAELRSASRDVPKAGHRTGDPRHPSRVISKRRDSHWRGREPRRGVRDSLRPCLGRTLALIPLSAMISA